MLEKRTAWVYITTNLINGKKYIGQTITPINGRWYAGSGAVISKAIKKYGKENFIREDVFEGDEEAVDLVESMYIEKYNAVESPEYYNLKEGGHHGRHGPETRKKISEKGVGRKASKETKQKMSSSHLGENNQFYGKSHTEESKGKIKEARKNQVITKESNNKRAETMRASLRFQCSVCNGWYLMSNLVQSHNGKSKKCRETKK